MMLEKDLEARCVRYIAGKGGVALKFTSPARPGMPDRLVITPEGIHVWIEFKTGTGRVAPRQMVCLDLLHSLTPNVYVCRSFKDFQHVIEALPSPVPKSRSHEIL